MANRGDWQRSSRFAGRWPLARMCASGRLVRSFRQRQLSGRKEWLNSATKQAPPYPGASAREHWRRGSGGRFFGGSAAALCSRFVAFIYNYGMKTKELVKSLLVPPGRKIVLSRDYDPSHTGGISDRETARAMLAKNVEKLARLQEMLYAQDTYAVLVVLQAMDAAGKDSAVKHVMSGVNPQGCEVHSFKAPSALELDHDFLWRCWLRLPQRGRIGIFNRSYYEEVLVVRVHPELLEKQRLPPRARHGDIWRRRFRDINRMERYLVENGTVILKFFLYLSKDEQKKRFLERIDKPEKNWKFSAADVDERQRWDQYMVAYEEMLNHTSTPWAPWHVVPADRKWFSHLAIGAAIVSKLKSLKLAFPAISDSQRAELASAKERLLNES